MKKAISVIILMFFSTIINAQKIKTYQCFRFDKNIDIFQSAFKDFIYSETGMFYYYIANDEDNIYINLRVFDDNVKQIIRRSGITVWINTNGKKKKIMGVRYPVGKSNLRNNISKTPSEGPSRNLIRSGEDNLKPLQERNIIPDLERNSLELIGFNEAGSDIVSASEPGNFRGSVYSQKEYLYYQVILPLVKLPAIVKNSKKKKEQLVIGLSHESLQSLGMNRSSDGRSGGGRGNRRDGGGIGAGMNGGRMGGGRMGGGGRGMKGGNGLNQSGSDSILNEIVWLQNVKLAIQNQK